MDCYAAAQEISQQVGVDDVRAQLSPEDKVAAVAALSERGEVVAMVGDGVNDAPALARADVGIAVGGAGSAQAMETADVVLMSGDLVQLPFAVRLSRRARGVVGAPRILGVQVQSAGAAHGAEAIVPQHHGQNRPVIPNENMLNETRPGFSTTTSPSARSPLLT